VESQLVEAFMEREMAGTDARRALEEVERQRAGMAERIRLPGWFAVLYDAALVALFVVPGLSTRPGHELSHTVVVTVIVVAVVVLSLVNLVLDRAAGARLRTDLVDVHVSAKKPMLMTGLIVLVGSVVTWVTAEAVSWALSIAFGLVIATVAIVGRQRIIAAIRHDVRHGQVVPR
jgi:hypothetical protein